MGKHHRQSKFIRNAAVAGATIAGVTALAAPAGANPLGVGIGSLPVAGVEGIAGAIAGGDMFAQAGAPAVSTGQQIVDAARSKIGSPYVWGATGPDSFDCSGLTSWAYQQVGKSIPRTSQAQADGGQQVSEPAPGDIVVFYPGATHVGIYSGNGNVIHAPQAGDVVNETSVSYMPVHSNVRF